MSRFRRPTTRDGICHHVQLPQYERPWLTPGWTPAPAPAPAQAPAPALEASPDEPEDAGGRVLGGWAERRMAEFEEQHNARALEQQREIDRLQRRISKLTALIEEQEAHERRVLTGQVDAGVSSVYREVQGISERDDHSHRKLDLMRELVEANLELRERITSLRQVAE